MVRILPLAVALTWALACSSASGATVSAKSWRPGAIGFAVEVVAAPGEQNRLTVMLAGDHLVLRDPAGLQSAPACLPVDAQTVHCPFGAEMQVSVDLGDGDDTFDMPRSTARVTVLGGAGDDVITVDGNFIKGGDLARLYGGPGNDRLLGEWVEGGPGSDVMEADFLFDYSDHAAAVNIDLERGQATSGTDVDQLVLPPFKDTYIWVKGGSGPDVIRAAPGFRLVAEAGAGDDVLEGGVTNDSLDGGPGNDLLRSGGGFDDLSGEDGDDRLEGGPGKDSLSGGAGNDVLEGRGGVDSYNGGDGADRIRARDGRNEIVDCAGNRMDPGDRAIVDAGDEVRACAGLRRSGRQRLEVQAVVRSSRTEQVVQVWCPRGARRQACAGRIALSYYREKTVTRTVRVAPGRIARVRFALENEGGYPYRVVLRTGQSFRGQVREVER
ncbi:hypothetical protein OJ998_33725 [Solirubrobacter taibaiensis]|nr:hypothetical protein [Solirubrobacter taibaiensis]